jgi:hypothetical protein
MMVARGQARAHGTPGAVEEAKEATEGLDADIETEVLHEERERTFRTPGFRRMRFDWRSEDRAIITQAKAAVDGRIIESFADAYQVMFEVYNLVRTPETGPDGGPIVDQWGFPTWKRGVSGGYEEDWTRLTLKEKENLMFTITTRIFEWEQRAVDAWAEAMLAKSQFEERFAIQYDEPMTGTVDDRKAFANREAAEERYFAIFLTTYSRKADALVRSLNLLGQRLKDSMTA